MRARLKRHNMKLTSKKILIFIISFLSLTSYADDIIEDFQKPLSRHWGFTLGTWTPKDGILTAFESGERRHGPVKMREKMNYIDAKFEYEFKLNGKAQYSAIKGMGDVNGKLASHFVIFMSTNDCQYKNLITKAQTIKIITFQATEDGREKIDLLNASLKLENGKWNKATIEILDGVLYVEVNGQKFQVEHENFKNTRDRFGIGGESGGPEGKSAGTLQWRNLKVSKIK